MKDIYEALARLHFSSGKCWNILFHIISISDFGKQSISISVSSVSKFSGVDMRRTYRCLHEISDRNIISKGIEGNILFNPNYESWRLSVSNSILPDTKEDVLFPESPPKIKKQKREFNKAMVPDAFWKFWNLYPNIRRYNLENTFKAWMKVNPTGSLDDVIIKSLYTFKDSDEWNRDRGKYIPAAWNFLLYERWETLPESKSDWRD